MTIVWMTTHGLTPHVSGLTNELLQERMNIFVRYRHEMLKNFTRAFIVQLHQMQLIISQVYDTLHAQRYL